MASFQDALTALKEGKKTAREGWNGKGMFVAYSPGQEALEADKFFSPALREFARANGGALALRPALMLKTAQGDVCYWSPSASDILSEDWEITE